MNDGGAVFGTVGWVEQTSGWLTPAERRSLVGPVAGSHARNVVGRLAMVLHLSSGRRAHQEATRVPLGRTRFLHRYGAFAAAIRLAPFDS